MAHLLSGHLLHLLSRGLPFLLLFLLFISTTPGNAASRNHRLKNLASCYSDNDCEYAKTFLRCHNRVCQCSTIHHYDEEMNMCLIRVGGSCTVGSREQYCVAYASCRPRSQTVTSGECRCRSRYWESIENLCISGAGLNTHNYLISFLSTATVLIYKGVGL